MTSIPQSVLNTYHLSFYDMMRFLSFNTGMRGGVVTARRAIHFNARRIRSQELYKRTPPSIAFKRSFSIVRSHLNMSFSPLRRQETAGGNTEPDSKNENSGNTHINNTSNSSSDSKTSPVPDPALQLSSSNAEASNNEEASSDDFLTTIFENLEPYIDTYEVYKQLLDSGFTSSQADEIINLLIFQLNTKLTKLLSIYSQLYELENEQYLFESAQQELHVDITRNREQHINEAINQINAMERDYSIISDELNNHFIQMKNDIQVAINDQKSENTLMSKKIMLRMQETNHKITTELNMAMRLEIESLRWHLSRWGLIAILMSIITACIGFYIYRMSHKKKLSEKNEFVPLVIYEPSEFDEDDYHTDLDPNAV